MKFFLIAVMLGNIGGIADTYVWKQPAFDSQQECLDFARSPEGYYGIRSHLETIFGDKPIDNVYCFSERRLQKFLREAQDVMDHSV